MSAKSWVKISYGWLPRALSAPGASLMTENTLAAPQWNKATCHCISASTRAGGTENRCHKGDLQGTGHPTLLWNIGNLCFFSQNKKTYDWFCPIHQLGKLVRNAVGSPKLPNLVLNSLKYIFKWLGAFNGYFSILLYVWNSSINTCHHTLEMKQALMHIAPLLQFALLLL